MTRFWLVFVLLIATVSVNAANPISADKLFLNERNSRVSMSPSGKFVLMYTKKEDKRHLILYDVETNKITSRYLFQSNERLQRVTWLNDKQIYLKSRYSGRSKTHILEINDKTFSIKEVTAKGSLVSAYPQDPSKVMFVKNKHFRLVIVSIEDLIADNFDNALELAHKYNGAVDYKFDVDTGNIIKVEYDFDDEDIQILYKQVNGRKWKTLLELEDTEHEFAPVGFVDDNTLAVITNKDSDKRVLRAFDIDSKTLGKVLYQNPRYDVVSAEFSDGKLVYVRFREHGLLKTVYFNNTSTLMQRLNKSFDNQEVYVVDKSNSFNEVVVFVNGATQPGEYFVYEKTGDTLKRLAAVYPDLTIVDFDPSKRILVKSADGEVDIEAFLTLPKSNEYSTLIVYPHGGPIGVQETDRFNPLVQYYSSRGFAVLRVNFRGSAGFGKAFQEQGVGEFGRLIESDISAVVDKVLDEYSFNNVCAMGASYGAYSSVMLAIKHPQLYKCVIASIGIYDLPLLFNASNVKTTDEVQSKIANVVGEYSEDMVNYSPVYLYKRLKAPILLIAGEKDKIADFEHTNRFYYLLSQRKHPVEKMFYKDSGHGHDNWLFDMNEVALSYEFLMRTLNLEYPNDESAREALAEDFAAIADGYTFDYERSNRVEKGVEYYKKASDFGHGRSSYNVAGEYFEGETVDVDRAKAYELYVKSAEQGYDLANLTLAKLILNGQYNYGAWDEVKGFLDSMSDVEKYEKQTQIVSAQFYCNAPADIGDTEKCLEILKNAKTPNKRSRNELLKVFSSIVVEGQLTNSQRIELRKIIVKKYGLNDTQEGFNDFKSGVFSFQESNRYGVQGKYESVSDSSTIASSQSAPDLYVGATFSVDTEGVDRNRERVGVVARWIKERENAQPEVIRSRILYGSPDGEWNYLMSTEELTELEHATLQFFNIDGEQLYSRRFMLEKSPVAANQ